MGDTHRWSGWPGAWCLDCGITDYDLTKINESCPCPDSGNHDPYRKQLETKGDSPNNKTYGER